MNAMQCHIIQQAQDFARAVHDGDSSGHDWWHIQRVARIAKILARLEGANTYLCELSAYLHDIADEKLNESKEKGYKRVKEWLMQTGVEASDQEQVLEIISTMSFSGGAGRPMLTLEGQIVQDADRLDAMGAIGIARSFAYAGWKGQSMYDPAIPLRTEMTREEYRKGKSSVINHFYEKLLILSGLLNTESARLLANGKHQEVELFLRAFDKEWAMGNESYLHESPIHRGQVSRVHIAFDDSTAGSLRMMLRSKPGEMVVTLGDDLMVGPLVKDQDFSRSFAVRNDWFQKRYSPSHRDENRLLLMESAVNWLTWPQLLMEWPCVIWAGNAASEQLGLRRLLSLMPDHPHAMLVDATRILQEQTSHITYRGTFELDSDKLRMALDAADPVQLTPTDQVDYRADWERLMEEDGVLRVLQAGVLRTVPESYFDAEILQAAYVLDAREGLYRKSARIIGEVIGKGEVSISDSFIESRVRHLIRQGILTYTGELDAMRFYSVSLVDVSKPEDQWNNTQRLANRVKIQTLLEEMMEIQLLERRIMDQLTQMDTAELGQLVSEEAESVKNGMQACIQELMLTYKPHMEQQTSVITLLSDVRRRLDAAPSEP